MAPIFREKPEKFLKSLRIFFGINVFYSNMENDTKDDENMIEWHSLCFIIYLLVGEVTNPIEAVLKH